MPSITKHATVKQAKGQLTKEAERLLDPTRILMVGVVLLGLLAGFFAVVRYYRLPATVTEVSMFVFGLIAGAAIEVALR